MSLINGIYQERKIGDLDRDRKTGTKNQESCFEHSKFESLYASKQRARLCGFI